MSTAPFSPGSSGRDPRGRFSRGNARGPGNPQHKQMALFRSTLLETVTAEDVEAVVGKLVERARAGEPWAVREFMDRVIGKPLATVELAGAGGEPLGLTVQAVQVAVLDALTGHPEARLAVATKLRELTNGHTGAADNSP